MLFKCRNIKVYFILNCFFCTLFYNKSFATIQTEENFLIKENISISKNIQEEIEKSNFFDHISFYEEELELKKFLKQKIKQINFSIIPYEKEKDFLLGFMDSGSCFSSQSILEDEIKNNQLLKIKEVNVKALNSITQRNSIEKCQEKNEKKDKHGDLVVKTYNSFFFKEKDKNQKKYFSQFYFPSVVILDDWNSGKEMENNWFKQEKKINFWNNSFVLSYSAKFKVEEYKEVIENMSNKILNEDNFFVFGLGNRLSGVNYDNYKTEQAIKNQWFFNQNKSFLNLKEQKKKESKSQNVFYEISQKLLPENLKNTKSILFVGGYDLLQHSMWDDISKIYKNNPIDSLKNQDFVFSKLENKSIENLKGASAFCLNAKENCLLADINLLTKDKIIKKGTSYSTSRVLYAAYILKKTFPFLTNEQLGQLILSNSINIYPEIKVPNEIYGYGVLNLNKSLKLFSKIEKEKLELKIDNNFNYELKENNKFRLYNFGNEISGSLIFKKQEKLNKNIINFKLVETKTINNKNNQITLKIEENNIVVYQNILNEKSYIENEGILFLDKKYIKHKNVKNFKSGKIFFVDFQKITLKEILNKVIITRKE